MKRFTSIRFPFKSSVWMGLLALTGMILIIFSGPVQAQQLFGGIYGQGDDNTFSMGVFRIWVAPNYRPLMAGFPLTVYNSATFRFQSFLMTDFGTVIGRSDAFVEPVGGVPVGTDGFPIDDADMIFPAGFEGPSGTREIHTRVKSLNLTGPYSTAVRAGDLNPTQVRSPGEVESKNTGGVGNPPDFPAESFFDVFVEIDLPSDPSLPPPFNVTNTLVNNDPLLVFNANITAFPPQVVYLHENTTAVPVYVKNNNPPFIAGDLFGYLVLAGHGLASGTPSDSAKIAFQNFVNSQPEMPLPATAIPTLTEWGLIIFGVVLLGFITWVFLKRRKVIGVRT
ncbi:MAG: hypothetical protein WCE90_07320 [Candidatus Zixiibacteriota bacterium]